MVRSQLLQMSVCVWITACTAVNDGLARAWRDGDRRGLSCAPCVVRSAADGSNRLAYDLRNGLEVLIEVHDDESALLAVAAMSRSGAMARGGDRGWSTRRTSTARSSAVGWRARRASRPRGSWPMPGSNVGVAASSCPAPPRLLQPLADRGAQRAGPAGRRGAADAGMPRTPWCRSWPLGRPRPPPASRKRQPASGTSVSAAVNSSREWMRNFW